MSYQSERLVYEIAKKCDSQELLEIIETNDFKGTISLVYTRRPDAYSSIMNEGQKVIIAVLRDKWFNRIAGFGACAINKLYVNGKEKKCGYLFTLRGRDEYKRKFPILSRGYEFLFNELKNENASLFFTTILENNDYAIKLFEKKRSFMPVYDYIGNYHVFSLKTGRNTQKNESFLFKNATDNDIDPLIQFLNNEGKKYSFYPVIDKNFLTKNNTLSYKDFYLLLHRDEIIAAGALWDQRQYKQYIVIDYHGFYRFVYPLSFLFPLFGYPALPRIGSILNFCTLSFWLIKENNKTIFNYFLNCILNTAKKYSFCTIGLYEKNPLIRELIKKPHILYKSRLYFVYHKEKKIINDCKLNKIPYLECGRL